MACVRECAVRQVAGSELASRRELLHPVELRCDLEQSQVLHVLHVGHDEALGRVHCHADVVPRAVHNFRALGVHVGVERREFAQSKRRRLTDTPLS